MVKSCGTMFLYKISFSSDVSTKPSSVKSVMVSEEKLLFFKETRACVDSYH